MESERDIIRKRLFVKEEDVIGKLDDLLSRVSGYVKIKEETGKILFVQHDLTIEQKIFFLLTVKYFRHKVDETASESATVSEMSESLGKPSSSLTKQINNLIRGDFIARISRGTYNVNYYEIERFLDAIEKPKE